MLVDFKASKPDDKETIRTEIKDLRARLVAQQQKVRAGKLPVLVLIEGWSAAGKGSPLLSGCLPGSDTGE